MKIKDKVIELATFLAYKDGFIVNEDFDFSSKLGSANTESYKVCRRADRFWAMALEVWTIITGAPQTWMLTGAMINPIPTPKGSTSNY